MYFPNLLKLPSVKSMGSRSCHIYVGRGNTITYCCLIVNECSTKSIDKIYISLNQQIIDYMSDLRVFKSEGWYVAELPSLHVVTRAKTMSSLQKNLKEAIDVAVEGMLALKSMKIKTTKAIATS